jgi:hypothetical protein
VSKRARKEAARPEPPAKPRVASRNVATIAPAGVHKSIKVDLTRVELPQPPFEATSAWVVRRAGAASFVFDQVSQGAAGRQVDRVEVRMPFEQFQSFVRSVNTDSFRRPFDAWIANHEEFQDSPEATADMQLGRARTARAQILRTTHVEGERSR